MTMQTELAVLTAAVRRLSTGWGLAAQSRVTSFTEAEVAASPMNFDLLLSQGGRQKPGRLTRSIHGCTVPTLEPE